MKQIVTKMPLLIAEKYQNEIHLAKLTNESGNKPKGVRRTNNTVILHLRDYV